MIHRGPWIQTFTGLQFFPLSILGPREDEIAIEDIAHALALQCRFSGHCKRHYSVAEHSIHVMKLVPEEDRLWALLHDAPEAYLIDVPRPLKAELPQYVEAEKRVMKGLAKHFGLIGEMPDSVKWADTAMLATEARDLMAAPPAPWNLPAEPLAMQFVGPGKDWTFWEKEFLAEFRKLTAGD